VPALTECPRASDGQLPRLGSVVRDSAVLGIGISREFYEERSVIRSASHHLEVKARPLVLPAVVSQRGTTLHETNGRRIATRSVSDADLNLATVDCVPFRRIGLKS
jgi:hypothetical protein